jgi:hypothetical protein
VRAWFNAQVISETVARGREAVEKFLQRLGRTAIRLEDLASQLGFKSADGMFEVVGKDEYSLRNIEVLLNPPEPAPEADEYLQKKFKGAVARKSPSGGVYKTPPLPSEMWAPDFRCRVIDSFFRMLTTSINKATRSGLRLMAATPCQRAS